MSRFPSFSARPLGRGAALVSFGLLATAMLSSAPVGAQSTTPACTSAPVLDLANPSPGDVLSSGDYIVSGVAHDPSIDRIDLFVGSRDFGGTEVGSGVPQQGEFAVTAKLPTSILGGTSFVAYAHSSTTGAETVVSVPVFLGTAPTPTPRTSVEAAATPVVPAVTQATCAPAAPPAAGASTAAMLAAPASSTAVLQLANPSAGDTLLYSDYVISGLAYVPSAPQGSVGVDRVEFFLGNRDEGGLFLGSAVPGQGNGLSATPGSLLADGGFSTRVSLPTQTKGGTRFYAYAHNSITSQETVVSVPVFVGAAPTPTPRPSSST